MSSSTETETQTYYQPQGDVYFLDGREERLLEFVQQKLQGAKQADPATINRLIDEYGRQHDYMMNVGWDKGGKVRDLILQHKPSVMLEFGSYVGYSTILFADALRKQGGKQYISFEREPRFARVAEALVRLAGLGDLVRFVVGSSGENIVKEHAAGRLQQVDMTFFDHHKPSYLRDLKICESLGLIHEGSVLVADNMIKPGNPTYKAYVESSVEEKRRQAADHKSNGDASHAFPERTNTTWDRQGYAEDSTDLPGDPNLVYESRQIPGMEPSGVPDALEVSVCKGKESA